MTKQDTLHKRTQLIGPKEPAWGLERLVKDYTERLNNSEPHHLTSRSLMTAILNEARERLKGLGPEAIDTPQGRTIPNPPDLDTLSRAKGAQPKEIHVQLPFPGVQERLVYPLSPMDPEALSRVVPHGGINPPIDHATGFMTAALRIPTPSATVEAISLDPKIAEQYENETNKAFCVLDTGYTAPSDRAAGGTQLVDIELEAPISCSRHLPIPIGSTVHECPDVSLALPTRERPGVVVEEAYQIVCYQIGKPPTVPADTSAEKINLMPTLQEMEYWQRALEIPTELRELLTAASLSAHPQAREEIIKLVASYMSSCKENGDSLFAYVCHPAVGELLRQQGEDLPFVLSHLKLGHCDYLAWYACALMRAYGVPAWMTAEHFPTKSGAAFNIACGHARVLALKDFESTTVIFDPTTRANPHRGCLPSVLSDSQVEEWGAKLKAASNREEKRVVIQSILQDIETLAGSEEAARAESDFYELVGEGVFGSIMSSADWLVSGDDLGAEKIVSVPGNAWSALQAKGDLERVKEICHFFDQLFSDAGVDWFDPYWVARHLAGNPEQFPVERRLFNSLLHTLQRLERPLLSTDNFSETNGRCVIAYKDEQSNSPTEIINHILQASKADFPSSILTSEFDSLWMRKERKGLSPFVSIQSVPPPPAELRVEFFLTGKILRHVKLQVSSIDFCGMPLINLPHEMLLKEAGAFQPKQTGKAMSRGGFSTWSYNQAVVSPTELKFENGRMCRNKKADELLHALLAFHIQLQKALFSRDARALSDLTKSYGLNRADIIQTLENILNIDTSRARGVFKHLKISNVPTNYRDLLDAYTVSSDCRRRIEVHFSEAIRRISKQWSLQQKQVHEDTRGYVAGDDLRYANWKASAKSDQVVVNLAEARAPELEDGLVILFDTTVNFRTLMQMNEIISLCKNLVRTGKSVFVGSVQNESYIQIHRDMCNLSNDTFLSTLMVDGYPTDSAMPGFAMKSDRGREHLPANMLIVGESFGRLIYLQELTKTVANRAVLWLGAPGVDVYPLPRNGS